MLSEEIEHFIRKDLFIAVEQEIAMWLLRIFIKSLLKKYGGDNNQTKQITSLSIDSNMVIKL